MKSANFARTRGFGLVTMFIILGMMTSMVIIAAKSVAFYKRVSQEEQVVDNLALISPAFYNYFYTECTLSATNSVSDPTLSNLSTMGYLNHQPSSIDNPIGSTFLLSINRVSGAPTSLRFTTTFRTTKRAKRVAKRHSIGEATFIAPATIQWDISTITYRNIIDANSSSYLDDKCK